MSRYQRGKTNLDFTEARDSEWQWHQLGYMQVCISLQIDNHASTPPLSFLQAKCPSCCPTNSVKALKAQTNRITQKQCPQPNPLDEQRHKNQLLPLTTARRGGMFNIAYSSSSGSVSSPAFSTTQPQDISSSQHII